MTKPVSALHRKPSIHLLLSVSVLITAIPSVRADELAVARYSTVRAVPTVAQQDLLAASVRTTLPPSVVRVGEAINALLAPSGYRLADSQAAGPDRETLLALPLPDSHRDLGPMPLRLALATLAGPAFVLVEDPVHRIVSFERCTSTPEGR
jgi:conjugative transfer region protein (TIGR03748 family)